MVTWGERPYPGLCPSAVVELVKVDILNYTDLRLPVYLYHFMIVVKLRRSLPIYFSRKGTAWRGPTIAHPLSILSCWTVGMGRCGKYDETHFNSTNTGIWPTGLGWACDEASRVGDAILYQFIKHIVIKLWCLLIWFQVRDTQPGVYLHLPPLEVNIN